MEREVLSALKTNWVQLSTSQQDEISKYSNVSGWRIIRKESIPSVFPQDFRKKMDSAMLIEAPTSTGGTYLVFNARRVDSNDKAIDQEPFGMIVHSTGPASSGMFCHHGDWPGRTTKPPSAFWKHVIESGIGNYFLSNPPTGAQSGSLAELPEGDHEAFKRMIGGIRFEE